MEQIKITWWNLENLFDTDDDPISRDFNYTPAEGWNQAVYTQKKSQLASLIQKTHDDTGPDILAVCEIEKDEILQELLDEMGRDDMTVALDPSGTSDLRGIDVALAYNTEKLELVNIESHLVHLRYRTRDILCVTLKVLGTDEELHVLACHSPSRLRGKYESEPSRIAVAENLAFLVDGLTKVSPVDYELFRTQDNLDPIVEKWNSNIVIVGDFNDEPTDRSMLEHLLASGDLDRVNGRTNNISDFEEDTSRYRGKDVFLYNATWKFVSQDATGTYFIDGLRNGTKFSHRYQVLDQIIVSRGLVNSSGLELDLETVDIFIDHDTIATDSNRPRKFNRTSGKGYSDHFPVTAVINVEI